MPEPGDPLTPPGAVEPGETRYRALFEALPDGLLVVDDGGFCVDANPSLSSLLGRPRKLLVGSRLADLALPERADSVARAFERLKATGVLAGELPLAATDGSPLELEWSCRAHVLPGLHLLAAHDVRARNEAERRLSAEHAVTRLLYEAESLDEATPGILEALCKILDGRAGALWRLDPGAELLRCAAAWISPGSPQLAEFRAATQSFTFARGEGLPGRVWAERTVAVIADLAADPNFPRRAASSRAGLTSGFGFPISVGGELFGVVEFFTDRSFSPDEPFLLMMTAIGHDIAQFVRQREIEAEVRRLHRDLEQKTAEHETIFNSVPALIWYKDDHNKILRVNRLAAEWAGMEPGQMEGRSTYELYPDEAEGYYQDDLQVIRSGRPKLGIVEPVLGPGGEKRWVRTDKIPYRNAEGQVVGVLVFAVDLTDLAAPAHPPA